MIVKPIFASASLTSLLSCKASMIKAASRKQNLITLFPVAALAYYVDWQTVAFKLGLG